MSVAETTHQQVSGIRSALSHLLPGCSVQAEIVDAERHAGGEQVDTEDPAGRSFEPHEAQLWVRLPGEQVARFTATRSLIPFSEAENDLLEHFAETVRGVPFAAGDAAGHQAELVANAHAFERMLTAQYLRDEPRSGVPFWAPELIISQLQNLAFTRYEGQSSSSGFVVVADPERYVEKQIAPSCYAFEAFADESEVTLSESFFDKPASHRYVDGQHGFYLIDQHLRVRGVLRCTDPGRYGQTAQAANEHIAPLLRSHASDVWIGYVGRNNDVNVVVTKNKHLRWLRAHWHFVDQYHLYRALEQQGVAEDQIDDFVAILLAVSDVRRGTLILIPDDEERLPEVAGHIDDSTLGYALYDLITGSTISELRRRYAASGMLTSDGLTTIARSGRVLGCGQIIRVENVEGQRSGGQHSDGQSSSGSGGGRTQAALSASRYGLVIKISEDGPISFFEDGQEQIRIVF